MAKKDLFKMAIENYGRNTADDGRIGKQFEGYCKLLIGNVNGKVVSAAGDLDTRKRMKDGTWATFEMKTGCGNLGTLDRAGNLVTTCLNADYMVYCYRFDTNEPVETQAYVLPMAEFVEVLNAFNLIYRKYSTPMEKRPVAERYYDVLGIQQMSSDRRRKCREGFITMIEERGTRYDLFVEENF